MPRETAAQLIAKCQARVDALVAAAKGNVKLAAAVEASQRLLKLQLAQFEARDGCSRHIDDVLRKETLH